jgi:hypothetical protein
MNQFTTARADQHRAELMAAAQHARDHRAARTARRRRPRLRLWRAPRPLALAVRRPPVQLPEPV